VATYSTGISVSWNDIAFQEIFQLSLEHGGDRLDRGAREGPGWNPSPGQIAFSCYDPTGTDTANHGVLGTVEVEVDGNMAYAGLAMFESVSYEPELNGVNRYTVTLRIIQ
jgi:hypothetical protein